MSALSRRCFVRTSTPVPVDSLDATFVGWDSTPRFQLVGLRDVSCLRMDLTYWIDSLFWECLVWWSVLAGSSNWEMSFGEP